MDICDYNFECMSRCCVGNVCSHFLECYQKCERNSECTDPINPCCSEGYCTSNIVCEGNKNVGDTCDFNSECVTDNCHTHDHICYTRSDISEDEQTLLTTLLVLAIIIFIFLFSKQMKTTLCDNDDQPHSRGGRSQNNNG